VSRSVEEPRAPVVLGRPRHWCRLRNRRPESGLVRIARSDLESKYRRIELLYQALENYFKLRGLWYGGAKPALPWLARHDPETHAGFERAFEAHASVEDLRALVQRILPAR